MIRQDDGRDDAVVPPDFHALHDRPAARAAPARPPRARGGPPPAGGAPPGADPESAVRGFLADRADLWGLDEADLTTVEFGAVSERGLRTARAVQRVGEAEVFGSDLTVALGPAGEVLGSSGQLFAGAAAAPAAATAGDAAAAVAVAVADVTGVPIAGEDVVAVPVPAPGAVVGPYRDYTVAAAGAPGLERPVRAKPVLFPLGDRTFVPGAYLELWVVGRPPFGYVVSTGASPEVLYRRNLQAHVAYSYAVHTTGDALARPLSSPAPGAPHPTGTPDGFQAAVVPEQIVTIESLLAGRPWLPAGATTTEGNNCRAYADVVAPDGRQAGDPLGQTTGVRTFGQAYDTAQAPTTAGNVQSSVAQMFFLVNWVHDRWYAAGFDEAAGNAQGDNFGLGGLAGDPVLAEGNDHSGTDNANMATPADGASPRMQMYRFTGPTPDRTSNHDAQIVIHELGHYLSNRLVGDAAGLTNVQGRAMGEGWGDLLALVMLTRPTDDVAQGCFAMGGWSTHEWLGGGFQDNYYFGIRRYPYSARLDRNPLTFQHITDGQPLPTGPPRTTSGIPSPDNNAVHNAGEVWCSALWQVFANLVQRHGFVHAERRMLRYVIGGLELTPSRPTFVQARDGVIAAVNALDRIDLLPVWSGFATRGLGPGAVAPPADSTTLGGVVEDFTVPAGLSPADPVAEVAAIELLL